MESAPIEQQDRRMTAAERRESIVRAAGDVFGKHGYVGTTTDEIARAAGISQPYVVRMFGSKEALFLEVIDRSKDALLAGFRRVLADHRLAGGDDALLPAELGDAYVDLTQDRGIHLPLMHAFMQGADPAVGAHAREGFLLIWHFLREEAGFSVEQAMTFLAQGMLINVLLGLGMPSLHGQREADELLLAACGTKLALVLEHRA